jgi:hypothetical protein
MFRLAHIEDGPKIIDFLQAYWKADHVYVRHPDLFYYDFQNGESLHFGLMENGDEIVGIFGYFFYNRTAWPDIGGMLWQVTPDIQRRMPLAGLKLRQFVMKRVKHRFFGAPGAATETRSIYQRLGMVWAPLEHFVGTDRPENWPSFIKINGGILAPAPKEIEVKQLHKITELYALDDDIFKSQTPLKDSDYLARRFLCHPFRRYQLWLVRQAGAQTVIVTRRQEVADVHVLRVIDVLGDPDRAASAIGAVFAIEKPHCAYVDFVAYGFNSGNFSDLGFASVDFANDQDCVPNHFEPLVGRSVQIFGNCDAGFPATTMVRGNGDQDRPNDVGFEMIPFYSFNEVRAGGV